MSTWKKYEFTATAWGTLKKSIQVTTEEGTNWVADKVAGGKQRVFGNLLGDVLHRDECHFEVAALHGDRFGTLLEEGARVVDLDVEAPGRRLFQAVLEHREHPDMPVLGRSRRRYAHDLFLLGLAEAGREDQCSRREGSEKDGHHGDRQRDRDAGDYRTRSGLLYNPRLPAAEW